MSTLKGLFDPKPRHQKNFLLENIRQVTRKNQPKQTRSASIPQRQPSSPAHVSSKDRKNVHSSRSHSKPRNTTEGNLDRPKKLSNFAFCTGSQEPVNLSSKTVHYIHKENVPFEWTEVCPSLISHTICHQGVQTEGSCCEQHSMRYDKLTDRDQQDQASASVHIQVNGKGESSDLPKLHLESPCTARKTKHCLVVDSEVGDRTDHIPLPDETAQNDGKNTHISSLIPQIDKLKMKSKDETPKSSADPLLPPPSYQIGVVPKYLTKRMCEQQQEPITTDPHCPPGHVMMPDDERKETLNLILKSYNELVTDLNKLPVRTDTLKVKQRKIELEKQLDKLEEGIRVFSRSKVYVKINS